MEQDKPDKKKTYVREVRPNLKIGAVVHEYAATRQTKKKASVVVTPLYVCALCPSSKWDLSDLLDHGIERGFHSADKLAKHLEVHEKRDERAYAKVMARECSMSDPIPGQLGFGELGVADVAPKAPRKKSPKKPRTKIVAVRRGGYQHTERVDADEEQRQLYEAALRTKGVQSNA